MPMIPQPLTENWVQIPHNGKISIFAKTGEARVHHGANLPANDYEGFVPISIFGTPGAPDRTSIEYSGDDNVYARSESGDAVVVVST